MGFETQPCGPLIVLSRAPSLACFALLCFALLGFGYASLRLNLNSCSPPTTFLPLALITWLGPLFLVRLPPRVCLPQPTSRLTVLSLIARRDNVCQSRAKLRWLCGHKVSNVGKEPSGSHSHSSLFTPVVFLPMAITTNLAHWLFLTDKVGCQKRCIWRSWRLTSHAAEQHS